MLFVSLTACRITINGYRVRVANDETLIAIRNIFSSINKKDQDTLIEQSAVCINYCKRAFIVVHWMHP